MELYNYMGHTRLRHLRAIALWVVEEAEAHGACLKTGAVFVGVELAAEGEQHEEPVREMEDLSDAVWLRHLQNLPQSWAPWCGT